MKLRGVFVVVVVVVCGECGCTHLRAACKFINIIESNLQGGDAHCIACTVS